MSAQTGKATEAVALEYLPGKEAAPRVTAKGVGPLAETILAAAEKNSIPIIKDETLAKVLLGSRLDEEIPADTFQAVARILGAIWGATHKAQNLIATDTKGE